MAKSKRYAPTPVLPDYYDDMLAQIMWNQEYPRGTTEKIKINGEWVEVPIAPEYQTSGDKRGAKMLASKFEDQKLSGLLGGSREKRKGEKMPQGAYSLADHEFLGSAMDWARTGNTPGGSAHIGLWMAEQRDPGLRDRNSRQRREWAAMQQRLLGGW